MVKIFILVYGLLMVATRSFCSHRQTLVEDGFQLTLEDGKLYVEAFKECFYSRCYEVCGHKVIKIEDVEKEITKEFTAESIQAGLLEQKNTKLVDSVSGLLGCLHEQKSEKARNLVLLANIGRMPKLCWQEAVEIIKSFEDYNYPLLVIFLQADFKSLEDVVLTIKNFNSDRFFNEFEFSGHVIIEILRCLSDIPQIIEFLKNRFFNLLTTHDRNYIEKIINPKQKAYFANLASLPTKERLERIKVIEFACIPVLSVLRLFDGDYLRLQVLDIIIGKVNRLYKGIEAVEGEQYELALIKPVPIINNIYQILSMFDEKYLQSVMNKIEAIYDLSKFKFYALMKELELCGQQKILRLYLHEKWPGLCRFILERLHSKPSEVSAVEIEFLYDCRFLSFMLNTKDLSSLEKLVDRLAELGVYSFFDIKGVLSQNFLALVKRIKDDERRNKLISYYARLFLKSNQVEEIVSLYTNNLEKYKALRLLLVDDEILEFKDNEMQALVTKFYENKKNR